MQGGGNEVKNPCEFCDVEYSSKCNTTCKYGMLKYIHCMVADQLKQIRSLADLSVILCEMMECENCPIVLEDCDYRTEDEKKNLHTPCCTNLYKWIIEKSTDTNIKC